MGDHEDTAGRLASIRLGPENRARLARGYKPIDLSTPTSFKDKSYILSLSLLSYCKGYIVDGGETSGMIEKKCIKC